MPQTVIDADKQCEPGWSNGHKNCNKNKAWVIKLSHRIVFDEANYPHEFWFTTQDPDECIQECLKRNGNCTAVTMNRLNTVYAYCYLVKDNDKVEADEATWAVFLPICCTIIQKNHLPTNVNHNLPIIFDLNKDCQSHSGQTTGQLECSKQEKRVWLFSEEKKLRDQYYENLPYFQRSECLNRCIDNGNCVAMNVASAFGGGFCDFHSTNRQPEDWSFFNSIQLKCCNFHSKTLWQGKQKNLPILYDTTKMCVSHNLYDGQQQCDVKIWMAIDGVAMENASSEAEVIENRMTLCLNKCLDQIKCVGVSMRQHTCYFHDKDNANMKYGYRLFTTFRLVCCNMK